MIPHSSAGNVGSRRICRKRSSTTGKLGRLVSIENEATPLSPSAASVARFLSNRSWISDRFKFFVPRLINMGNKSPAVR